MNLNLKYLHAPLVAIVLVLGLSIFTAGFYLGASTKKEAGTKVNVEEKTFNNIIEQRYEIDVPLVTVGFKRPDAFNVITSGKYFDHGLAARFNTRNGYPISFNFIVTKISPEDSIYYYQRGLCDGSDCYKNYYYLDPKNNVVRDIVGDKTVEPLFFTDKNAGGGLGATGLPVYGVERSDGFTYFIVNFSLGGVADFIFDIDSEKMGIDVETEIIEILKSFYMTQPAAEED